MCRSQNRIITSQIDQQITFRTKPVGCDISAHQIKLCKETIKNNNIEYYVLDFSNTNIPVILGYDKYDIIYTVFVILYIETLDKLKAFIENCYKCLKTNGKVIICTLDILSASFYPEVFNILRLPVKSLTKNYKYTDGCPIQIEITEHMYCNFIPKKFRDYKTINGTSRF